MDAERLVVRVGSDGPAAADVETNEEKESVVKGDEELERPAETEAELALLRS